MRSKDKGQKPLTSKDFSWDVWKNEQKKISLRAWHQWYHQPYECDWHKAHNMALMRKWQIMEGQKDE